MFSPTDFLRRLLPVIALSTLPCPAVRAGNFTIQSAADYAVRHNPELAAARAGLDEARARVLQTGGLGNPELETGISPNLAGREFTASIGISQKFPLTNRLKIEKELSEAAVNLAEIEIRTAGRTLAAEVKNLAVKSLAVQAQQAILTKQTTAARDLAAATAKAAAAGETPPLEAAQLDLEVSQLAILSLQAKSETATLTGALRPLLGSPPQEPVTITGSLAAPGKLGSIPTDLTRHPAYQAALAKAESARHTIDLAKASRWEDLTVGVGYERSHADDAGVGIERENMAVLRFSLPLPFRKHNAGHIAEAEAAARRTDLEATATAAKLRAEAAAALGEMQALTAIHHETTDRLLPQAAALETRFSDLQKNGQAPLADVLRARRQRLSLEAAALDARRDFHLARLRYETAAGR